MELTQLRYFLEVAKSQHITKSAEKLHIAQPALTQAVHRLEKELDIPLFMQKGRNIVLTSYGKYFQTKLEPIIEELDKLPEALHTMSNLEDSTVHLNVLAASSLVTDAIIEYKKIDETLRVQLQQNISSELYDICVNTNLPDKNTKYTEKNISTFVYTEKIHIAVPNIAKFQNRKTITLEDVEDEDFISLSGSKQLRNICDSYCQKVGIKPNFLFESDSPAAVKDMIGENMGIGFWPDFSWGKINTDRVKLLELTDPPCKRNLIITYKENKHDSTKAKAFFEYLAKYIQLASEHNLD